MLESSYVDDLPYSVDTKERRDELIAYSIHMLSQFGYSTKGFDGNELSSKHNETLDDLGRLLVGGYFYHTSTDELQLKLTEVHNGRKHRGRIIQDKTRVILKNGNRIHGMAPDLTKITFHDSNDLTIDALEHLF